MKNGVILAILASLIFSIMNALVKEVSSSIPTAEVVFFRSLIGTIIIFILMRNSKVSFSTTGIPMLALRGALGAFYLIAYFYTISKIPLADASILAHLSPFFAVGFSFFLLKERVPKSVIYILPLTIIGAILLVKPFQFSSYSLYAFIGITSAVFAGAAATSIRYLSKKHHSYEIVFYFLATATVVSIPLMWNNFVLPSLRDLFLLICIGVVSLIGQIYLTKSFTHANVVVVEMTRYIGIVFNAMWGLLFWKEVPDTLTFIGGMLIIASCVALSRMKETSTKTLNPKVVRT
ncbi:DMT family transporter [Neobacillus niacini]|uniref:DMT family transporter n=1 Tax=Neobacillus niacini TaxID=86668 RepID=UPI0021CB89BF|nr:DMT family transporter [Neobacillus niacini]MCM3765624.1 DMT family transporter [Neobacillus niacini]